MIHLQQQDQTQQQDREEEYALLLAAARTLHENGQETSGTLAAARRMSGCLGLQTTLTCTWDALFLQGDAETRMVATVPSNVNMGRVLAVLHTVEEFCAGRLDKAGAKTALASAGRAPESSLGLFAAACVLGAGALSVINGASHWPALSVIMICAGIGALLRRRLEKLGVSSFSQVFCAAALAGGAGAGAVHAGISSEMRLAALGPLLVLVPGPAILGGTFDFAALRLPLGGARLGFGLLTILMLCAGVLSGLALGQTSLPAAVSGPVTPWWADTLCAGIAAAAYGVFFSLPLRLLALPVLTGMAAHAVRWALINAVGFSNAAGAGIACLVAGSIMVPAARRLRLPFASVGFASVVSMVPGIFLFRMSGGLVQIQKAGASASPALLGGVLSDAATALATIVAMALGLLLPMRLYEFFGRRRKEKADERG